MQFKKIYTKLQGKHAPEAEPSNRTLIVFFTADQVGKQIFVGFRF